jgi:3-oxoadipate enol-lactonase
MAFASINGTVLHHEFLGDPEAEKILVFSNSLGTDFRIWLPVFDELDDDVAILVYDKRGHGLSGLGATGITMDDHVNDLIGLVEHLSIKQAFFCGLSVGGLIVQGLCARRPDLVRGLVLCNTATKIGTDSLWNERIAAVRTHGIASLSTAILKRWFTEEFHADRPADLEGYRAMLDRQPAEGYIATCAAIRDTDYTADAAKITVPVLCIAGDKDGSTPPELVKSMADRIAGSTFAIIPDCGHIPCIEQPEALANLIAGFIQENGRSKVKVQGSRR